MALQPLGATVGTHSVMVSIKASSTAEAASRARDLEVLSEHISSADLKTLADLVQKDPSIPAKIRKAVDNPLVRAFF